MGRKIDVDMALRFIDIYEKTAKGCGVVETDPYDFARAMLETVAERQAMLDKNDENPG